MPDPKLQEARKEIERICNQYDIGAVVVLASESHLEFLHKVDPSWSCAQIEHIGTKVGIRIRSKLEDYPSKDAQKKCMEDTIGMFIGFIDALTFSAEQMKGVAGMVAQKMEITHWTKFEGGTRSEPGE